MKTYSKRIAFVISAQHLIPHGGIGQFCKGFTELAKDAGWCVDIILDKSPNDGPFVEYLSTIAGKIIYSPSALPYKNHQKTFAFSDSMNIERMYNFRESMMLAFQENIYDMIVVNTPEAIVPIYGFGIQEYLPIVFYTHNENMVFKDTNTFKGVFNDSFDEFFLKVVSADGIVLGTQCQRNVDEMVAQGIKNSVKLPMPLPERDLRTRYDGEREGVLFIGRWEDRKNPKEYLRVIEETKLPARVMTNETGAKNFERELTRIGVPFDIRIAITGQEKCDFIKQSKVFYMPSKSECYSFAFFETHGHVPSVVIEDYKWYTNFDTSTFSVCKKADVVAEIKRLYASDARPDLSYILDRDAETKQCWIDFLDRFKPKQSNSNQSNFVKKDNLYYHDHIKSLGRFASIEDVISVLANRAKYQVVYTDTETWFSQAGSPPEESKSESVELSFD